MNALMERSVKDADHDSQESNNPPNANTDVKQLNIAFYQFAFQLNFLIVAVALFWVDLVPGYGTSDSMADFGER